MWLPSPGREANAAGPLPAFYCLWWPSGSWQLVHEGAIIGRGGKGRWAALSLSLWPCVCTLWLMGYVREISIWLEGRWWTQKCSSVFKFILCRGLPWWLSGRHLPASSGDAGSIPRSGEGWRALEKEMAMLALQYSCLKHPVDRGAWQTTVHGIAKESAKI